MHLYVYYASPRSIRVFANLISYSSVAVPFTLRHINQKWHIWVWVVYIVRTYTLRHDTLNIYSFGFAFWLNYIEIKSHVDGVASPSFLRENFSFDSLQTLSNASASYRICISGSPPTLKHFCGNNYVYIKWLWCRIWDKNDFHFCAMKSIKKKEMISCRRDVNVHLIFVIDLNSSSTV